MSFEHITIITVITGITDITVIGIITGTIERNFLVKGRCGISFAVAPHVSGWSRRSITQRCRNEEPPRLSHSRGRGGLGQMMWRCSWGLLTAILPVLLVGCASQPPSTPPAWSYYDDCAAESPSFVDMAKCGREKRLAQCEPKNECSPEGNLFMEFADRLALSVKNKQRSDSEAFRLLAEYKTGRPCTVTGTTVNCAEAK